MVDGARVRGQQICVLLGLGSEVNGLIIIFFLFFLFFFYYYYFYYYYGFPVQKQQIRALMSLRSVILSTG